eukprot:5103036-Pleurochrysis_carterae.AAC.1
MPLSLASVVERVPAPAERARPSHVVSDSYGRTPLYYAIANRHHAIARRLKRAGARRRAGAATP